MPSGIIGPDEILNQALAQYLSALQSYFPALLIWGSGLLGAVIFCGLGYALFLAILNRDWFSVFMSMMFACGKVAILWMVMRNLDSVGAMFPTMGAQIGAAVSGQSPNVLTPSGFYTLGLNIIDLLFKAAHYGMFFHLIAGTEFLILIIITQVTWFAAGAVYMWTEIECRWIEIKGTVTVCFAAFPNTFNVLENWLVQLLRIGIKLMATLLILAAGLTLATLWSNTLGALGTTINSNQIEYGVAMMAEAVLVFYSVWHLPAQAVSWISGGAGAGTLGRGAEDMFQAGTKVAGRGVKAVGAAI